MAYWRVRDADDDTSAAAVLENASVSCLLFRPFLPVSFFFVCFHFVFILPFFRQFTVFCFVLHGSTCFRRQKSRHGPTDRTFPDALFPLSLHPDVGLLFTSPSARPALVSRRFVDPFGRLPVPLFPDSRPLSLEAPVLQPDKGPAHAP